MRTVALASLCAVLALAGASVPSGFAATGAAAPAAPAALVPDGVSIAGVAVGGLSPDAAWAAVRAAFERPLPVLLGGSLVQVQPAAAGAVAYARQAVATARRAQPGQSVPLTVSVRGAALRSLVATLAARFDRQPVDSQLVFRGDAPWLSPGALGRALDRRAAAQALTAAFRSGARETVSVPFRTLPQKVSRADFGPVVVVDRTSGQLRLYDGMTLERTFRAGVGESVYPTPLGRFSVAVKWRAPWWYPPPGQREKGLRAIPPGPGNPLGVDWLGLGAPGLGIHGTPDEAAIGYSLSHGCVRLRVADAKWLFDHVDVGTPVFIVAA